MTTRTTPPPAHPQTRTPLRAHPPRRTSRLVAVRVLDEVYRVEGPDGPVGYVERAGPVFVCLAGAVYNTSLEVAQCLDLETAVERLRTL